MPRAGGQRRWRGEHRDDTVLPGTYEVWGVNFDGPAAGDFAIEVAGDVAASFSGTLPATSGVASEHFTFTL